MSKSSRQNSNKARKREKNYSTVKANDDNAPNINKKCAEEHGVSEVKMSKFNDSKFNGSSEPAYKDPFSKTAGRHGENCDDSVAQTKRVVNDENAVDEADAFCENRDCSCAGAGDAGGINGTCRTDGADGVDGTNGDDGANSCDNTSPEDELAAEKDKYLRLFAEYDNFRKRSAKEKSAAYSEARASAITAMLPVYDNLERALKMPCSDEAFYKGVEMTMTGLCEIFENLGITVIESLGKPFDPNLHNAVMSVEDPAFGEKIVSEEFQKGFILGDKVIRFSTVVVAN